MIRNPNDIQDGAKKIRMLIAGYPGIGKSTLALSAPRPLHIDCDFGIDRIEPRYQQPSYQNQQPQQMGFATQNQRQEWQQSAPGGQQPSYSQGDPDDFSVIDDSDDLPF